MSEYRVNLDIYNGPMDLLLYLIRRDEIDIHDIPIARITEQYCRYVETLKQLDPDLAGEFLVMAATLMEIKTRMLLPRPEGAEEDAEPFDPRAELVRQLLEYKAFKDAAGEMREAAVEQSLRFGRPATHPAAEETGKDLEEVQLWDLVEAFNGLLAAIGQKVTETEVIYDDTPLELHAEDILDRLRREGNMTFRQIFTGRTRISELIGLFLAMLELARRRQILLQQEAAFGEIYVYLNPDPPAAPDETSEAAEAAEETETSDGRGDEAEGTGD